MKQTPTIPETFLGIGYTKDRGLPRRCDTRRSRAGSRDIPASLTFVG
jgi:hypothetical protein